jgi:hypothetical protein
MIRRRPAAYDFGMDPRPVERVALLIVRAWLEGPERRLIARVTMTPDVAEQPATVGVVGSAEDLHDAIRGWLQGLRPRRDG